VNEHCSYLLSSDERLVMQSTVRPGPRGDKGLSR
jgi:hypothetical protein